MTSQQARDEIKALKAEKRRLNDRINENKRKVNDLKKQEDEMYKDYTFGSTMISVDTNKRDWFRCDLKILSPCVYSDDKKQWKTIRSSYSRNSLEDALEPLFLELINVIQDLTTLGLMAKGKDRNA